MSDPRTPTGEGPGLEPDAGLEPERYELREGLPYHFALPRRGFLQLLGGIVVLVAARDAYTQESGRETRGSAAENDLAAWLHVAEDGTVTVFTGKVEVGQNARTSLAQAVADELHAPIESIGLVMADTDRTPFDAGTFGSRSTPYMAPQLRKAAAVTRELLKELAAREWGVEAARLTVADGKVTHAETGRSAGFGALTKGQKLVRTLSGDVPLTPAERWTVAGRSVAKLNARDIVTGRHRFTSDLGPAALGTSELLHGRVLRPPALGATLASVDPADAASRLQGLWLVTDADFTGVVAPRTPVASRALEVLRPQWTQPEQPEGRALFDLLRKPPENAREGRRGQPHVAGSVAEALPKAAHRLESTYTVAYIAHVPLEPRAAVADWKDGRLTVWVGTQRPFGVKSELAEAFKLAEDKVRVIVPDTGSGYGGKHSGEHAIEAARLARGVGRPVKLVWTREEEFRWAYFRPAGVIDVKSGADADGRLVAWEMHNYNSGSSSIRTLYEAPHQHIEFHPGRSPLRQGSYRGLAATANHFARESHMDEIAATLKLDPLEFRLRNLKDARLRAVLEAAAERFGWAKAVNAPGRGHGIAGGFEKGSYVATAAEVRVEPSGAVTIVRLVASFECGAIVNPRHLESQVLGSVIQGMGGALFEAVEFDRGQILNPRLSRYRVPRFSDAPPLEVVLLDRKDLPSAGAGETPIVAVAPAIAGAIFAATGTRLRAMPLAPKGVRS
ncbi:MAG: molybdopterin cofactor-binding domain-containing protein [Vicinamibacterales bacterium]